MNAAFDAAQWAYESREHPDFYADDEDPKPEFDKDYVDSWIDGYADSETPELDLFRDGIALDEFYSEIGALLQTLAQAKKRDPEAFANLIGCGFFRAVEPLASAAYKTEFD